MHLKSLLLVNFKNYSQLELEFDRDVNCIIGQNGAGKTNILDAIYYLSMSKSYLNPIDTQNIKFEESFFLIQGEISKDDSTDFLHVGVKKGAKKVFKKNKVAYEKLAEHIGQYPVVIISPYDRNLIQEGSETRRKWLDGLISQLNKEYLNIIVRYNKVLDQRNALLKNMSSFGFFNRESIEVWDEQLISLGNKIYTEREKFLRDFIPIFNKYYKIISNNKETVSLNYKTQLHENDFKTLIVENEKKDFRKQYTTVGTHKDDLIFTIEDNPVKKFGSQGQQKSFLIALRLAQFEWLKQNKKMKPILMLDDIFDKLDQMRVKTILQMVCDKDFGQVFITDTDANRIDEMFSLYEIPVKLLYIKENQSISNER